MKAVFLFVCVLALIGCTTTKLTPEESKVRVTTNPNATNGCKFLEEVVIDVSNTWGEAVSLEEATLQMKKKALSIGADVVFREDWIFKGFTWTLKGEAYDCTHK